MLMPLAAPSVFAYTKPADMRRSFSGLVGIIEQELKQTVESGHLFLFFNRRRNCVKVLYFVGDGLVIFYKRLELGTFEMPQALHAADGIAGIEMRLRRIDADSRRHRTLQCAASQALATRSPASLKLLRQYFRRAETCLAFPAYSLAWNTDVLPPTSMTSRDKCSSSLRGR